MNSQASSNAQPVDLDLETGDSPEDLNDDSTSTGASDFASALAKLTQDDEGADDTEGHDDNGKPRESGKKVKLDSLDTLAASLGIEVKELYGIKVPASGGR